MWLSIVVRADSRVGNFAPRKSDLLSRLRQWFEKVMATWLRCCLNSTDCSVLLRLSPIPFRQPNWTEIIFVLFEFETFIFYILSFARKYGFLTPILPTTVPKSLLGCPRTKDFYLSNFSSFLHTLYQTYEGIQYIHTYLIENSLIWKLKRNLCDEKSWSDRNDSFKNESNVLYIRHRTVVIDFQERKLFSPEKCIWRNNNMAKVNVGGK